jgi:hypothetical protein
VSFCYAINMLFLETGIWLFDKTVKEAVKSILVYQKL